MANSPEILYGEYKPRVSNSVPQSEVKSVALKNTPLTDKYTPQELDSIITDHMALVRNIASRINSDIPHEDLVSFGVEGLLKAALKYDPSSGAKLSTYALPRIRGEIIDQIRVLSPYSRAHFSQVKLVNDTYEKLAQSEMREPTLTEIAQETELSPQEVAAAKSGIHVVPIDDIFHNGQSTNANLNEHIKSGIFEEPGEALIVADKRKELKVAIGRLNERERQIIALYFQEGMSLKDIAKQIGNVSESRAAHLKNAALKKLRATLESENVA